MEQQPEVTSVNEPTKAHDDGEIGAAELEAVSGGVAPAWWWIATFILSESNDFVQGFKDGMA